MDTMPSAMISVITPSLNSGGYLEEAIRSVLTQQYPNFEHIVVDGGSEDGTLDILRKYPHLKWVSEPDKGQSDAMNKGFALSRGEIIVYLNADDYFEPNVFQTVAAAMSKTCKFIVGQVRVQEPDGKEWLNDPKVDLSEMLRWWQPNAYCYNSAGYFYDREMQHLVGGFNVDEHLAMDFEFLIKARRVTSFTKINKVLACFRIFPGTKTYETSDNEQAIFAQFDDLLLLVEEPERRQILEERSAFFAK